MSFSQQPCDPVVKTDLPGKTVIVTGANTGIGLEAAKHFASMSPARLIMTSRNKRKGDDAVKALEKATGYKKAELLLLDLSSLASVVAFTDKFEQDGGKIDILVANAGVFWTNYVRTPDGFEESIQVNHISTVLVSILLLPHLLRAASKESVPRLVVVSSGTHYGIRDIDPNILASNNILEALSDEMYCTKAVMMRRYPLTKLLNVLFVRALTSRLANSSIIVNCADPGFCASELTRNIPNFSESLIPRTPEEGSRHLIWAAIGGKGREDELRGGYVSQGDVSRASELAVGKSGKGLQDRLWKDTMDILTRISPKVAPILELLDRI